MFLSVVHSLLLLSARLESGGKGGGGTAFNDSISCLWTTAVPSLQRQMLSVLPLWFRLQSKQETQRLKNTAPAWTSQTCITTVPLKCTTALSPGKWKVIVFADVACVRLTRNSPPSNFGFAWFSDVFEMRKTAHECVVLESMEGNYSFVFIFKCHRVEPLWKKILQILIAVFTITEEKSGNKTVRMWVAWGVPNVPKSQSGVPRNNFNSWTESHTFSMKPRGGGFTRAPRA